MLATATASVTATVGHPTVAALLGLGAAGLAAVVVAMAWNVHVRQIRLAELLARRQIIATAEEAAEQPAEAAAPATANGGGYANGGAHGNGGGHGNGAVPEARGAARTRTPQLVIDGPDTVVAGEQVRYSVRPSGNGKVVTWAAGGGSVFQSPDPAHPDQLLLIADRPGNLMITARVREGLTERRENEVHYRRAGRGGCSVVVHAAGVPARVGPRRGGRDDRRIRRRPGGPGQPCLLRLHRPGRPARCTARRAHAGHRQDRRRRGPPRRRRDGPREEVGIQAMASVRWRS